MCCKMRGKNFIIDRIASNRTQMSVGKNMQACFMLYVHCMAELLYIDWRYEDMIKVIASDMDGTLLCDDHRIAPDTIAAVKEACAAGIRFMVATGRGYEGAMAELDGTGIVCDYILGSGAEVRDPQRKIVKECGIGMELCREICEEVKEFPISIVFLTNEGDYRIGTEKEVEESIIAEMQLFHVNMTREEVVKTSEYRRAIESVKVVSDFEEIEKDGYPGV